MRSAFQDDRRKNAACFFFQAEDGIRGLTVTGVQTCALPISCVALGIGVDPNGESGAALPAAAAYAAQVLQASGRTSDCVGSLGPGEFAVLAPGTAPEGAAKMAQRLARVIETAGPR